MTSSPPPIAPGFYRILGSENRIENLLATIKSKIVNAEHKQRYIESSYLGVCLKFAIIRLEEKHSNFLETEQAWQSNASLKTFTGFGINRTELPISIEKLDQFWNDLNDFELFEDNGLRFRGREYVRRFLLLVPSTVYPTLTPCYATNTSRPVPFLDRYLTPDEDDILKKY